MINLPEKDSKRYVRGIVTVPGTDTKSNDRYEIAKDFAKGIEFRIQIVSYLDDRAAVYERDVNYRICDIDACTPQGLADQIANAITEARDIGFEQGRRFIREALGIR